MAVLQAALALGLAFGLNLSNEQIGAILAFVNVTLALVTRSQVTPMSKLDDKGVDLPANY